MSVHKKCQPIRSSRLAGYREHIYEFLNVYYILALKGPALLVEKNDYFSLYAPRHTLVSTKNFIPFGPAVWPAIGNIYIYIRLVLL